MGGSHVLQDAPPVYATGYVVTRDSVTLAAILSVCSAMQILCDERIQRSIYTHATPAGLATDLHAAKPHLAVCLALPLFRSGRSTISTLPWIISPVML